ncbi:helix-turn-helix domain-containing protein [Paenibacillus roseipurpureus]|uniref:Helix-turn-helix domain-containing protein n=1 Tax=Paenibacillus roseopurpureus TaxID=2918901 RepID=A0AA96RHL2_9BACL|nr:helix-turn-helix domain-containing protein [Paenibacillus sp. MBLB1832]WNR43458.1 helix-turn-helix domain-containing protein [Paenibacillus sp. MBLB1832]
MKKQSSPYFIRLFIFSLLLGSLPVMVVSLFSYVQGSATLQSKVNEANMQTLQQTQLRVEQMLKTLDHSVTQLISSPLVVNAMSLPYRREDYPLYNEMYQAMVRSQIFELSIRNMTVLNLKGEWGIDNTNIFTFDENRGMDRLLGYTSLPLSSTWVTEVGTSLESSNLHLIKKIPLNSLQANGMAVVTVSFEDLSKLLLTKQGAGRIGVLDTENRLISNDTSPNSLLSLLLPQMNFQRGEEGQFNLKASGEEISIIYKKSAYNGWTYVSASSVSDLTSESRAMGLITVATCLLLLLVTGGLALLGSRQFYRPLQQLVANFMSTAEPNAPSEKYMDEFVFIGNRYQVMSQKQFQLAEQVKGQVRELKQFFVLKLLQGGEKDSEVAAKLQEYGYPTDWSSHTVLAIQIDTLEGTRYEEKDRDLLLFALQNIVGELIPRQERLEPVLSEHSQVTIVKGMGISEGQDTEWRQRFLRLTEQIQVAAKEYLGLPVSIGVSKPRRRLQDANFSVNEALEALRYRIRTGIQSILFFEDVNPGGAVAGIYPERAAKELYDAVKVADLTKAVEELERCITFIFERKADWRQYHLSLVRLYSTLMELVPEDGQAESETAHEREKGLLDKVLELNSQEEVKSWFLETVIAPIVSKLEDQRRSHAKQISDQVVEMIHNGYDTEITLEGCAALLHYHPNHLGPLFSKEKGISFSEYLQSYRLTKAKEWLVETDMKIIQIAERLTYTNPQNFIRFFRKMEGMTPGQYRDRFTK